MRILTNSEVANNKNGYALQVDTSALGKDAHKVIFSNNTFTPYFDQIDWAITHIGVPYAIKDGTTKLPYEKIDCAGLVTATKIQELGQCGNPGLKIGPIYSLSYYNGSFGDLRLTEQINRPADDPDFRSMGGRGFLLFIHKRGDNSQGWQNSRHIMIIYYSRYIPETNRPSACWVIEAAGRPRNCVRYSNALAQYKLYNPDAPDSTHYMWTVLKWAF